MVIAGGQSQLARSIGGRVKQQHVYQWLRAGIPADHVIAVARAVQFAVSPHELRPDIYPNAADGLPVDKAAVAQSPVRFADFAASLSSEARGAMLAELELQLSGCATLEAKARCLHAAAIERGASFSFDDLMGELQGSGLAALAERAALTLSPAPLMLNPAALATRDIAWESSRSADLALASIGDASVSAGEE